VSFDGSRDEDADQAEPVRDAIRAPGLDRIPEAHAPRLADRAENSAELRAENVRLGRAVGELSTENAELYKRVGKLEAELKTEKAQRTAWSTEVARDREQAAAIIADIRAEIAELRQQPKEKSPPDRGPVPDRLENSSSFKGEKVRQQAKGRFSNEIIAVGVTVGMEAASAAGDMLGAAPAEAGGLIAGALGIAAAVIAWARKRREDQHADRP
jgi:hypothetical protein